MAYQDHHDWTSPRAQVEDLNQKALARLREIALAQGFERATKGVPGSAWAGQPGERCRERPAQAAARG